MLFNGVDYKLLQQSAWEKLSDKSKLKVLHQI